MRNLLLWVVLGLVASCTPSTVTPVPGPDADAVAPAVDASSSCAEACAALADAGCSLGSAPTCPIFLQTLTDSKESADPTGHARTCAAIQAVRTKADAQRLGFVCAP